MKFNSLILELSVNNIEKVNQYWSVIKLKYVFGIVINLKIKISSIRVTRDNLVKKN